VPSQPAGLPVRPLNDPRQYDDLADTWWDPRGRFAMLHWIAEARASLVPTSTRQGSLLLDLACGAGLLAPHVSRHGHRHVGLDLSRTALPQAREHGVTPVRGDVLRLPFAAEVADVVVAGEVLEHVTDPARLVAEACRVLRPGGTLVLDTIADTWWGRFSSVTVGERMPAGPPKRLHDPALFIDRDVLVRAARTGGVELRLTGLRPSARDYLGWLAGRREGVRMRTTRSTAGLFQAVGRKTRPGAARADEELTA
jgi:2-polyprenyl-6-hydroxyphenyl methylase / 3-demethylubiquinone-9 3-methyltransferase